jgi:signal transduction histidine kinase
MVVVADQVLELASVTSSEASIYWIELVFVLAASLGFLVGLLRTRMTRAAVGDLVVELGSAGLPAEGLREALARRLGDPSLEILYHVPTRGGYVDADGRRVELPQDDAGRIVTLLESDGTPIAALVHDEVLGHDPEILEAVSAAAQLAIANERLRAEVRSQLEEVRASRARIVQAGDAERRRVERDLHDGAQQRLVTLSLRLGLLRERVETVDGRDLTADLDSVAKELHEAIDELRELSRGIHPTVLTDEGLGAAVESLVDRSPIHVTIEALPVERWSAPIEATAYFVAAEALTNAAKHAPGAEVRLSVSRVGDNVRVVVVDDGPGGARLDGSGLRGLEDRVAAAGGSFSLESRPGEGTVVRAEIPCHGN